VFHTGIRYHHQVVLRRKYRWNLYESATQICFAGRGIVNVASFPSQMCKYSDIQCRYIWWLQIFMGTGEVGSQHPLTSYLPRVPLGNLWSIVAWLCVWFVTKLGSINMADIVIQLWYRWGATRVQPVISRQRPMLMPWALWKLECCDYPHTTCKMHRCTVLQRISQKFFTQRTSVQAQKSSSSARLATHWCGA